MVIPSFGVSRSRLLLPRLFISAVLATACARSTPPAPAPAPAIAPVAAPAPAPVPPPPALETAPVVTVVSVTPPLPGAFSIAVVSDLQSGDADWRSELREIRDRAASGAPSPEILLVVGDFQAAEERYATYRDEFRTATESPVLLPVIGNHEFDHSGSSYRYIVDREVPILRGARRLNDTGCNYVHDFRNVRIIVADAYTRLGANGVLSEAGIAWVRRAIESAPRNIAHIFVALHEPAFPRHRHYGDSFDADRRLRDAFWRMLVKNRSRVRALLVGHTHAYYRMRVLDPSSALANSPDGFPMEAGGVWQVNTAAAAYHGEGNMVLFLAVDGDTVLARAMAAGPDGRFLVKDEWRLSD